MNIARIIFDIIVLEHLDAALEHRDAALELDQEDLVEQLDE